MMIEIASKLNSFAKAAADTFIWLCGACVVLLTMAIAMATVTPIIVTDMAVSIVRRMIGISARTQ